MRKIISNLADSYGLYDLHKEYSNISHFRYNEDEADGSNRDASEFYKKPMLPEISFQDKNIEGNYECGILKFSSQVNNGDCNKESVFHYRACLNKEEDINVILVHGWRAKDLNRLGKVFLDSFMKRKYNIYNYVLPFHMERAPKESLYSGEYFISSDVSRTLKSAQQSVSDIRALISYIKEVRKGRVIVLGLSLGGIVTNLVAETEENIDALISLFYANDLSFTVFQTEAGKYIKKDFVENNFNRELLSKSWSIINPCLRKPIIDMDKILLVSGRFDKYVLNEDTDKLWENWGRPKRYIYASGHSGIVLCRSKVNRDVIKFIDMRV